MRFLLFVCLFFHVKTSEKLNKGHAYNFHIFNLILSNNNNNIKRNLTRNLKFLQIIYNKFTVLSQCFKKNSRPHTILVIESLKILKTSHFCKF